MTDRLVTLLPYPVRVREMPGRFAISAHTLVTAGPGARDAAGAVRRVLTPLPLPQGGDRPPGGDGASGSYMTGRAGEILVDTDRSLAAEGYRLFIGPDRVKIAAGGPRGAFYAAQTIRQLLPDDAYRITPLPGGA